MTCEDYPCCGHGTEGCEDRPEFHSEYWRDPARARDLHDPGSPEWFDAQDDD